MFTPTDINSINEKTVAHALIYKGTCLKTRGFMLDIETSATPPQVVNIGGSVKHIESGGGGGGGGGGEGLASHVI
jgi:hypothetical protein